MHKNVFVVLDLTGPLNVLMRVSEHYAQHSHTVIDTRVIGEYQHVNVGYERVSQFKVREEDVEVTIPPITPLDRPRAMLIVRALVEEYLSQTLRYREPESATTVIAQALRDCAIPEAHDMYLAEDFLTHETIDSMLIDLHLQLGKHLNGEQWRQWEVFETSRMMALVGGQDYRIVEYHRQHGMEDRAEGEVLSVEINTVANYIHQQLCVRIGEAAKQIPLRPMLIDAITRRYPRIAFGLQQAAHEHAMRLGVMSYEAFFREFIDPVMKDFDLMFLRINIDPHRPYTAEITQGFTLRLYHAELPADEEARACEELRQSIERGDWIPERERRRLEAYERYGH